MDTKKIYNENGQAFYRVFADEMVEGVNPVEYYKSHELKKRATLLKDLLAAQNPFLTSLIREDFFVEKAEEMLSGFWENFEQTRPHDNFIKLLDTTKKKDQEKLLKGMALNPEELMSLILISYNEYGYMYSKYLFENLPGGLEGKKFPQLFHLQDDESVVKIGETDLGDGELKKVITHRKVIVSHFFEKDSQWHCFFVTYNSIGGKENWKGGQAHFHYISSAFGISKEEFIESMKTGKYKSTSIHIDLLDYGNQTV